MAKITVSFEMEKDTKNTIRFKEVVDGPLDVPQVGTIYVPKTTLKTIGYEPGSKLQITIGEE